MAIVIAYSTCMARVGFWQAAARESEESALDAFRQSEAEALAAQHDALVRLRLARDHRSAPETLIACVWLCMYADAHHGSHDGAVYGRAHRSPGRAGGSGQGAAHGSCRRYAFAPALWRCES